jgi:CheY-like chemotaxis protein
MDCALIKLLQPQIESLKVLALDNDHYMRKVVRAMLNAMGVKRTHEGSDGTAGLDAVRKHPRPDHMTC